MIDQNYNCFFSTREYVNLAVRYILSINSIIEKCNVKQNIVDVIEKSIAKKELQESQVKPILSTILRDKWKYKTSSRNLASSIKNVDMFVKELSKWDGLDIVLCYEHPELGFLAINPKNPSFKSMLQTLKRNELLTVYVGMQEKGELSDELAKCAIDIIFGLVENIKRKAPKELLKGEFSFGIKKHSVRSGKNAKEKDIKQENDRVIKNGIATMSQILSVTVSNELFHNGNVEAWKNIIQSYKAKYRTARVLVFYEGEEVSNINALFRWGKVRYGSVIKFAVLDEEPKELSKLYKYLKAGAGPYFETFLLDAPYLILNLF